MTDDLDDFDDELEQMLNQDERWPKYRRVTQAMAYVARAGDRLSPVLVFECRRRHRGATVHGTPQGLLWLPERQNFKVSAAQAAAMEAHPIEARYASQAKSKKTRILVPAVLLQEQPPDRTISIGFACTTGRFAVKDVLAFVSEALGSEKREARHILFPA